MMLILVA